MQSLNKFWQEMMQIPEARWIVLGTLLLFVLMIAIYVSFLFRDMALGKSDEGSTEILSDFRRMRDDGYLEEEEYTKLKSQMPEFKQAESQVQDKSEVSDALPVEEKKYLTLAEAQKLKEMNNSENDTDAEGKDSLNS